MPKRTATPITPHRSAPAAEPEHPTDTYIVVAVNRRAHFDYDIDETMEAGIVLTGTEVKSLRAGHCNVRDAYGRIEHGEAYLWNAHIAPYSHGNRFNHEPTRTRKLLLHRKQIALLEGKVRVRGYTLVPLRLYFHHNYAKVELGLGRGKKTYDKREDIAKQDAQRDIQRALANRVRGR